MPSERRPKKRCIEAGGKEIHAIRSPLPLPLPLPQAWAAQCGDRHCPCGRRRIAVIASAPQPACPRSRPTPVAPGGSLQASMDPGRWFTLVPTGSSSLRQFPWLLHTWAPICPRSCDARLQADACEPRCPARSSTRLSTRTQVFHPPWRPASPHSPNLKASSCGPRLQGHSLGRPKFRHNFPGPRL